MNSQDHPIEEVSKPETGVQTKFRKVLEQQDVQELLFRVASFQNNKQILDWLSLKGRKISVRQIDNYRYSKTHKATIERYREQWNASIMELPLANKRKRIENYQDLYKKAVAEEDISEANNILKAIKAEVEGESGGRPNIYNYVQYNNLSDGELEEKRLKIINDVLKLKKMKEEKKELIDATHEERIEEYEVNEEDARF